MRSMFRRTLVLLLYVCSLIQIPPPFRRLTPPTFPSLFAAPVHQMKEYYVYGTVDDCTGHWTKLMDCLKRKTTRYKDSAALDPDAKTKHPLWTLRTGLEAKEFWRNEFQGEGGQAGSGTGETPAAGAQDSTQPTIV